MKQKLTLPLIIFCCLTSAILVAQPLEWVTTTSYDGKFKISCPGPMGEYTDTIETALGNMAYHTFLYQSQEDSADNVVYMLSYCDYPTGTFSPDSLDLIQAFFEATVEESAASVRGEVQYASAQSMQEEPGYIWRVVYLDGKAVIKSKAVLVGDRYYAVQAISRRERSLNRSTDQFLASFQFF